MLLLVIGVAVTEIAVWGRRQHAAASRRAGYLEGINDARTGGRDRRRSPSRSSIGSPQSLTVALAALMPVSVRRRGHRQARRPASSRRHGRCREVASHHDAAGSRACLQGPILELLVESGGRLQGRFLMQPDPDAPPTREQLLVAVALADQAGAALAPATRSRGSCRDATALRLAGRDPAAASR